MSGEEYFAKRQAQYAFAQIDYLHRCFDQPKKCALSSCGKTEHLLKCAQCKRRYYCSREHQSQEWPEHKLHCRRIVDPPAIPLDQRPHPPLDEEQRAQLVKTVVNQFNLALHKDKFCSTSEYDSVFGWGMKGTMERLDINSPIGTVMMGAWNSIVKRRFNTMDDVLRLITFHLLRGDLPEFFREQAHALRDDCSYCRELWYREYKGINWNQRLHFMLSGQQY